MANQALGYVAGHAVWSIGVPIAIAELLASGRSAAPWLGRTGLAAAAVLYGAGCAIVFSFIYAEYRFLASPVQLAGAAAGAALCVMAAFALRAGSGTSSAGVSGGGASGDGDSGGVSGSGAPGASGEPEIAAVAAGSGGRIAGNSGGVRPWLAGAAAFAASGAFVARPEHGWIGLVSGLLLPAAAWYVVRRWSGSPWWSVRHRTALVSGALLTYAWLGFYVTWLIRPGDRIAWFGNVLFALTAIALALIMARQARAQAVHRESSSSRISMNGSGSSSGSPSPFSRYSS